MANVTAPSKERWIMVLILLLTLLVAYVDRVNVSVLMADNAFLADMGIKGNPVAMGLLMTAFLAAYGLGNVFLSPIGDILGPRKAMSLSILLWCVALFMGGYRRDICNYDWSKGYSWYRRGHALAHAE